MRKAKISFTLLASMLLVFAFAAVTFAAAPTSPKITNFEVKTATTVDYTFTATGPVTHYGYVVTDAGGVRTEVTTASATGTITFVQNASNSQNIKVELWAYNGAEKSTTSAIESSATHNLAGKMQDPAINEVASKPNANQTGFGDYLKAKPGHSTHGAYTNNTNSCASCHQTHTASSNSLLFKPSVYQTCVACHDGTLGFYNVFETDMTRGLGAGTFGGTHAGNMSAHMADGSVKLSAAPGINTNAATAAATTSFTCTSCHDPHGSYSDRLLAANPNGWADIERKVGNATNANSGFWYGNKLKDVPVSNLLADATVTVTNAPTKAAWGTGNYTDPTKLATRAAKFKAVTDDTAKGGHYYGTGVKPGDNIIQLYRWDVVTSTWKISAFEQDYIQSFKYIDLSTGLSSMTTSDLNGTGYALSNGSKLVGKYIGSTKNQPNNVGWMVLGAKGFVRTAASTVSDATAVINAITYMNLEVPMVTSVPKVGVGQYLPNGNEVMSTSLTGIVNTSYATSYNYFCSTCHMDYLTAKLDGTNPSSNTNPGLVIGNDTGTGNQFVHHTMSNNYTCVRCHYAHGTDVDWMLDGAGKTVGELTAEYTGQASTYEGYMGTLTGVSATITEAEAKDAARKYLVDVNASSALKRYTNMSVCYGCHTSSHAEYMIGERTHGEKYDVWGINVDGSSRFIENVVNDGTAGGTGSTTGTDKNFR